MDINSNSYTFLYATIMTLIVAVSLAAVATGLKPMQLQQEELQIKQSILASVMPKPDKAIVQDLYNKSIKEVVISPAGKVIEGVNTKDIELRKEYKKPESEQQLPLYIYEKDGKKNYIMPLYGAGLWDAISGYVALDDNKKTIAGAVFDHVGETPGLGAEITKPWFQDQFKGRSLYDGSGKFVSVDVLKGRGNDLSKSNTVVDGMSGATITGDGVEDMIRKGVKNYLSYLGK